MMMIMRATIIIAIVIIIIIIIIIIIMIIIVRLWKKPPLTKSDFNEVLRKIKVYKNIEYKQTIFKRNTKWFSHADVKTEHASGAWRTGQNTMRSRI